MTDVAGYSVSGSAESLIDSLKGRTALVCGNAETVFDEVYRLVYGPDKLEAPVIFACNDVGMYLPTVHHWVSLHADKIRHWVAARKCDGSLGQEFVTHTSFAGANGTDYNWQIEPSRAPLSGFFAMQMAYIMGAEQIILCGCPADGTRRFFDVMPRKDYQYGGGDSFGDQRDRKNLEHELKRVPAMKARVRSMSGRTREIFGAPEGI